MMNQHLWSLILAVMTRVTVTTASKIMPRKGMSNSKCRVRKGEMERRRKAVMMSGCNTQILNLELVEEI